MVSHKAWELFKHQIVGTFLLFLVSGVYPEIEGIGKVFEDTQIKQQIVLKMFHYSYNILFSRYLVIIFNYQVCQAVSEYLLSNQIKWKQKIESILMHDLLCNGQKHQQQQQIKTYWMQAIRANGVNNFNYNPQSRLVDPKNLLAIDRVRCTNCAKYFPLDQIHNHLKTHQIYNGAIREPNRLPPSSQAPIDIDHDLGYNSNRRAPVSYLPRSAIDIQTMAPEELPNPESVRRKIPLPLPGASALREDREIDKDKALSEPASTISNFSMVKPDGLPGAQIKSREIPADNFESFEPEEYYDKVNVGRTRLEINPKSIPVYSNHTNLDVDEYVDKKKEPIPASESKSNSKLWKVEPRKASEKQPDDKDATDGKVGRPRAGSTTGPRKTYVVDDKNILPAEEKNPKIDTRAIQPISQIGGRPRPETPSGRGSRQDRGGICGTWNICGGNRELSPETDLPTHTHYGKKNNFACPACGGFFCPVCKSTVPPNFRPPPGYKEYLEHSRSTHHTLFANTPSRD